MLRAALLIVLALFPAGLTAEGAPARVVSMNLCTDQLAMMLARPGQLVALSWLARDPVSSALWAEAAEYPTHGATAEEIHAFAPDLVLAGTYDPPATIAMLRRLGLRVETFGLAESFDAIRRDVTRMGAILGTPRRSAALLAEMDALLAEPLPAGSRPRAAFYYANGYTSGSGTLAHEIMTRAGLVNVAAESGYAGLTRLPLELLLIDAPDLLVTGRNYGAPALAQEVFRHPAMRTVSAKRAQVADNLWACGTPLAARAVQKLRAAWR